MWGSFSLFAKGKVLKLLTSLFILASFLSTISVASAAYEITATIPVGVGPWGIAYDSGKGEIFVANYYDDTVSVISDSSNTVIATVPVGSKYWHRPAAGKICF